MDIDILIDYVMRVRGDLAMIDTVLEYAQVGSEENSYLLNYAKRDARYTLESINELLETLEKLK